jgi:hypothetical protein
MKKRFFFAVIALFSLLVLVLGSCEFLLELFSEEEESDPEPHMVFPGNPEIPGVKESLSKTIIEFDNTQGICAVIVYRDHERREQDKIAEIAKGGRSAELEWTPSDSVPFYFSYPVSMDSDNIRGFSINYNPGVENGRKAVRIDAYKKTIITIPILSEIVSSDALLSDRSYLIIQNNSLSSFELHRSSSPLRPNNLPSSAVVNNAEQGHYTVSPGPASPYQLLINVNNYKQLPGSLTTLQAGHVYCLAYNGSEIILLEEPTKLTVIEVLGIHTVGFDTDGESSVSAGTATITVTTGDGVAQ